MPRGPAVVPPTRVKRGSGSKTPYSQSPLRAKGTDKEGTVRPPTPSITITTQRIEGLDPMSLTSATERMKACRKALTAAKLDLHDAEVDLKYKAAAARAKGLVEGSHDKLRDANLQVMLEKEYAAVADAKRALIAVRCEYARAVADVRLSESLIEMAKVIAR